MYGLKENHINKLLSVFTKYGSIEKVVLYGSRAKGNYRNGSDIDLTLVGNGLNSETISLLERDLDDLLLPYKTDISILNMIKDTDLLSHINRVGVELYKKQGQ